MKGLRFWKTQTIGNDFVLVHADDVQGLDLPALSQQVCVRRFGVGSDGLLVLGRADDGLHLQMFNPDGTEDFCGNGLRCAALHALKQGWVKGEHRIEHFGRLVAADVSEDGLARTAIGPAVYDPEEVPVVADGPFIDVEVCGVVGTAVSTGTTHFVSFVERMPSDEEFESLGPRIENDAVFPQRTSVIFARESGKREVTIRIWERGVGETLGCGTGSSAVAAEWMRRHGTAGSVRVINPGGVLEVSANEIGGSLVTASRPVEVFEGVL
ncbi:MAG TPA: diaminopimelate epimerase [Fimbriimonadaceae bacterium]|nr:diaminopimelate epimerase [Fimbriimonadaceae bacterium]